ncbi:MAG: ABC transporter ATP-binding protein [Bacillota bacterium]|nr:ABC transporter ATP-binding protein [Bacillota bacterium]
MDGERRSRRQLSTGWRLLRYAKPYWREVLLGFLCVVVVSLVNLYMPMLVGRELVDRVLGEEKSAFMLNILAVALVFLFLVRGLFLYGQAYLMAYVGQRMVVDLRNEIYQHLQRHSLSFYERRHTGEMIARITSDTALIQNSVTNGVAPLAQQLLLMSGALVAIFVLHWRLALLTLVVFPAIAYAVNRAGKEIRAVTRALQERVADLTTVLQETLSGIRIVKAFTMEEHERKRFAQQNEANFAASMKSVQITATIVPLVDLLFIVGTALVLWYGGHEVLEGRLTLGGMMAFLGYLAAVASPVTGLSGAYALVHQALGAADRIFALLDTEPDLNDLPGAVPLPRIKGKVVFHQVGFAYEPGRPVLEGINLTVEPGEVVALVGPSGAGKTTLVNLIPRFYDPTEGWIEIDGFDIRRVRLRTLRAQIGLVPQETVLFGLTVRENIAYGRPDATEEEIKAAARMANAHDFIMALPEGYETRVSEAGISLSGGQRQRIAIARALLRDPRILILDEATSALDPESEQLVQEALEHLMEGRTTFVIAHRFSTIRRAHRIIVIEGGRIVEEGKHEELLARKGAYYRLHELQFHSATKGV